MRDGVRGTFLKKVTCPEDRTAYVSLKTQTKYVCVKMLTFHNKHPTSEYSTKNRALRGFGFFFPVEPSHVQSAAGSTTSRLQNQDENYSRDSLLATEI